MRALTWARAQVRRFPGCAITRPLDAVNRRAGGYKAARMSSTRSLASPNSIAVFSLKKSGFWTPA